MFQRGFDTSWPSLEILPSTRQQIAGREFTHLLRWPQILLRPLFITGHDHRQPITQESGSPIMPDTRMGCGRNWGCSAAQSPRCALARGLAVSDASPFIKECLQLYYNGPRNRVTRLYPLAPKSRIAIPFQKRPGFWATQRGPFLVTNSAAADADRCIGMGSGGEKSPIQQQPWGSADRLVIPHQPAGDRRLGSWRVSAYVSAQLRTSPSPRYV